MRAFRRKERKEKENIINDLDESTGSHLLNDEEREMIHGVMTLDDTTVKETMVPRIDGVFINSDLAYDEVMKKIVETGYSRYPVFEKNIDNVIGVLYVKDLLKSVYNAEKFNIKQLVRKAFFVPESKKLDSLLREFRKKRVHMAVAVDEYGGVSGILCLEDIIERIVGDIQDEFDNEQEDLVELGKGEYLCDARMNIDELNNELGLSLPNEDFDTIGGFVFDLFGKIPGCYESVTYEGFEFIVQQLDGHKIKSIKIIINREDFSVDGAKTS